MERDDSVIVFVPPPNNFNSHAHVERDAIGRQAHADMQNFNSHAHVERDWNISDTALTPP